ncbi:hypothetical protein [Parvularcula sp. IMCC14364]|uniref:hypothetical protein n=1 Tax=Parvularcula sp. IMCC14364 TaxID=3067902 RepID=UPI002742541B|nr:hypothetical protein [Parvularcula sp. IMCC14364]
MIKKIIPAVLMLVFVVGGVFAADMLRPSPVSTSHEGGDHGGSGKGDHADDNGKGDDDHGGDYDAKQTAGNYYFNFSRQFVVPVMQSGRVQALVILDLNLEMEQGDADGMFSMEPKFRDALMRELLALSNEGYFTGQLTDPERYDEIQKALLRAARTVKDEIISVLILDFARQEQ